MTSLRADGARETVGAQQHTSVGLRPAPRPSSSAVSLRMQKQRRRDTDPEMLVRRALHRRGLRYRLHVRPIPSVRRTADIVFRSKRVAVFVDGCFWHGCPDHGHVPNSNEDWWKLKLERNRVRDLDTTESLRVGGWTVVRIWEHEHPTEAAERIEEILFQTSGDA